MTLHSITEGVDEGPIWYQEQVPYEMPVTGAELYSRVVDRSWKAFCERWASLREGNVEPKPQAVLEKNCTFRRVDLLEDQQINADDDEVARAVLLRLLAHDFSPGYSARVLLEGKLYNATLKLSAVEEKDG